MLPVEISDLLAQALSSACQENQVIGQFTKVTLLILEAEWD
jgi:hypothetical protein